MHRPSLSSLLLCLTLTGCGLGSSNLELPPERPYSKLSGQILHMKNAEIQVYAFGPNGKGERLGGGQSDENGQFQIELQVESQPVLLQVTSGNYQEAATGTLVSVADDLQLKLVTQLTMGEEKQQLEISVYSHLMTALVEYFIQQGIDPDEAINQANQQLVEALQLDILKLSTNQSGDKPSIGNLHSAYSTAISYLTRWANEQNGSQQHQGYNSLSLAKLIYADAHYDGQLNGVAENLQKQEVQLALGTIELNEDSYRMGLAQQLIIAKDYLQQRYTLAEAELLNVAVQLTQNSSALFGNKLPLNVPSMAPKLSQIIQSTSSGIISLEIEYDSDISVQNVHYYYNGSDLGEAGNPANPVLEFDSTSYNDGTHYLDIQITDILGNSQQSSLPFQIDNIYFTLETPLQADRTYYQLWGKYYGDEALSLNINNTPMDMDSETHSWSGTVQLAQGENTLNAVMQTTSGETDEKSFSIILVDSPPAIADAPHGSSRIGQNLTDYVTLQDSNPDPLLLDNSHLDLAGTLIARDDLNTAQIPFFAFHAYDTDRQGNQIDDPVQVSYQYFINDIAQGEKRELAPIDNEYLIPLSSETLHSSWHHTTRQDQHRIVVSVTDSSDQTVQKSFDFRLDVLPPAVDLFQSFYSYSVSVPFEERAKLSGANFEALRHELSNNSSKDFMLYLEDTGNYQLEQTYTEKRSEHLVDKFVTPIWRVTLTDPADGGECPSVMGKTPQEINQIWDYTGASENNGFSLIEKPDGELIDTVSVDSIEPPPDSDSASTPLHLNDLYAAGLVINDNYRYEYDYVLNPYSTEAAHISGRVAYVDTGNGYELVSCDDIHTFEEIQRTHYQSAQGYPKNLPLVNYKQTYAGSLDHFIVRDLEKGSIITSENGWYRIPAGARIRISKVVALPNFTLYNDPEVLSSEFDAFESKYLDESLNWTLSGHVNFITAHDINDSSRMAELTSISHSFKDKITSASFGLQR